MHVIIVLEATKEEIVLHLIKHATIVKKKKKKKGHYTKMYRSKEKKDTKYRSLVRRLRLLHWTRFAKLHKNGKEKRNTLSEKKIEPDRWTATIKWFLN